MFKFNFGQNPSNTENENHSVGKKAKLSWLPAEKINVTKEHKNVESVTKLKIGQLKLKLVDSAAVTSKLAANNSEIIVEAESKHSDLLPAKYEGGLKIWECTFDLANYLLTNEISLSGKTVLDLGCGAGVLGVIALLEESVVDFQDYNVEVINNVTIPNVIINSSVKKAKKCNFYCGDWKSFKNLLKEENKKKYYDFIFTSETIYNSDNQKKLYNVFKRTLKNDGVGYIAAKSLYFGVGGTIRQFEELVLEDKIFDVSTVWTNEIGVQREILKLQRKIKT